MSIRALHWAFGIELKPATRKLLLLALADCAGDSGEVYPSLKHLEVKTCMNVKTIIAGLDDLEASGFIEDLKKTRGTGVKTYRVLMPEAHPKTGMVQKRKAHPKTVMVSTPKNGNATIPENGNASEGSTPKNGNGSPGSIPENGNRTIPENGRGNHKEEPREEKKEGIARKRAPLLISVLPTNLDTPEFQAHWEKWQSYLRKRSRKPITEQTLELHLKKLVPIGPDRAIFELDYAMERGWAAPFPKDRSDRGRRNGIVDVGRATPNKALEEKQKVSAADLAEMEAFERQEEERKRKLAEQT
jgi:hypothetical protein